MGEAVASGSKIEAVIYAPDLLRSRYAQNLLDTQADKGIDCIPVSLEVFHSLAEKDNPQGIIAVVCIPANSIEQFDPIRSPWLVALVSPQDPGNIGTILRTIDAVGANGLILLEESAETHHPSVVRASMGAIFWIPYVHLRFDDFLAWRNRSGYTLIGSSAHAVKSFDSIKQYPYPCILLLGSERKGISSEQSAQCDYMVKLPMHGHATSLNLAVAAGVLLYDMLIKKTSNN